jgi:hypothetical protein
MIRKLALVAATAATLTALLLACSGSDSGPYACGATTCQSGEICVHPCCGGAPPPCVPADDGGTCPAGYSFSGMCFNGGDCAPPPCTPPPAYCAPASSAGVQCSPTTPNQPRDCYLTCA